MTEQGLARAYLPCSRCRVVIEVTDPDVIAEAQRRAVDVFHEHCQEAPALRRFRVEVRVVELLPPDPDSMAALTGMTDIEAEELRQQFADAAPGLVVVTPGGAQITHVPREVELTGVSAEAHAETFVEGLPELEKRLGELWLRVVEHAAIVDGALPDAKQPGPIGSRPRLIVPS